MDIFYAVRFTSVLFALLQVSVSVHILMHKEDEKSAIAWIGLVWLAPILGSIFYIIFGINRIRRKALALRNNHPDIRKITGQTPQQFLATLPPPLFELLTLGYKVHPQYFSFGNRIIPFLNGDNAYPQMCRLIASAQKEVLLQSYIFANDTAGKMFLEALKTAVQNGASVKVLTDGVGVNYTKPNILCELKKIHGLEYAVFLPAKRPVSFPFVNLRNHRKILVVDGETAFFGGMNIAAGNLQLAHPKKPITDITFQVSGPVVGQMVRTFEQDWLFAGKGDFFPFLPTEKETFSKTPARIIPDGPDGDYGKIERLLLGILSCAQREISIVTPYFLLEKEMRCALETAVRRGVKIEVILPQKSNIFGMDLAMQAAIVPLLQAGVQIYRSRPPFDHSKICVADGEWVFIGSANWDARSLKLNFECNMECLDKKLAASLQKIIHAKKRNSLKVSVTEWNALPFWHKLAGRAACLLTPYY